MLCAPGRLLPRRILRPKPLCRPLCHFGGLCCLLALRPPRQLPRVFIRIATLRAREHFSARQINQGQKTPLLDLLHCAIPLGPESPQYPCPLQTPRPLNKMSSRIDASSLDKPTDIPEVLVNTKTNSTYKRMRFFGKVGFRQRRVFNVFNTKSNVVR